MVYLNDFSKKKKKKKKWLVSKVQSLWTLPLRSLFNFIGSRGGGVAPDQ